VSWQAVKIVLDQSRSSGLTRLVFVAIAAEADQYGGNARPGVRRLARRANCHTATVIRSIEQLEHLGELIVHRPTKRGPGKPSRYELNLPQLASEPAETARTMRAVETAATARAMRAVGRETARIDNENRAHPVEELRAPMRADPLDPYIDPVEKLGHSDLITARESINELRGKLR
jgi:hypothetical protein